MSEPKNIQQTYNNLKTSILGTQTTKIDKEIDSALDAIETYSSKIGRNRYLETIKDLVKQSGAEQPELALKDFQSNFRIEQYDKTGRLSRYNEYDAILAKISYCQRALKVLTDNIISPDDITKRSINILSVYEGNEKKDRVSTIISRLTEINKAIKFEQHVVDLVTGTLKKGDYFVEILYTPKGEHALTIVNEQRRVSEDWNKMGTSTPAEFSYKDVDEKQVNIKSKIIVEYGTFGGALSGINPKYQGAHTDSSGNIKTHGKGPNEPKSKDQHKADGTMDEDEFDDKYSTEEKKTVDMRDIYMAVHDPKYILRLETERFRTCLGYLVFPKVDPTSLSSGVPGSVSDSVDAVCLKMIENIEKSLRLGNDKLIKSPELKNAILVYLKSIKNNEDLVIRYVPPEMMVHWRISTQRFYPYGESIFESVNFDCRLLIALKTAMTIKRLSHSTDKRFVSVETGLPRDARNLIESVKEGMKKRKVSIDSMGSIDTIPSQIQTFEDIYIPMKDGKKFIEIDHGQFGANPSEDVEGLKFIRDNIVANLGVPAPFLGLEENTSNRALLTVENINFCRTIIAYQKEMSVFLKEFFDKVYNILYPGDSQDLDDVTISFAEPKISPYEHEMEYVEQMQRLIEALTQLGIPKEYLKKKYLPNIDWAAIDRYQAEEKIKIETGETEDPDDSGLGGMGGGGFGGMV